VALTIGKNARRGQWVGAFSSWTGRLFSLPSRIMPQIKMRRILEDLDN
jgi:hypothetical protein